MENQSQQVANQVNSTEQNNQIPLAETHINLVAVFCYIGVLFWVPIFICKESPKIKFHVRQGFIIFALEVLVGLLAFLNFGIWLSVVVFALMIVCLVLSLMGIINVIRNKEKLLPIIGKYALKISFPHMKA